MVKQNNRVAFDISNLSIGYQIETGYIRTVRTVSLSIYEQECFGLVGESGSGKSTLALGSINYLPPNGRVEGGEVRLKDQRLDRLKKKEMGRIWGKNIGMVYQNPMTALNPAIRIGKQLAEVVELHQAMKRKAALEYAFDMLTRVSMPNPGSVMRLYPHQLSGGMLQRCVIAMALMNNPDLLIMDEPTTALDVTTQAVVLDLIAELKVKFGSAILYITHDLSVLASICERIAVMYAGEIVEIGKAENLFAHPRHPYTRDLITCIPQIDTSGKKQKLQHIPGRIPQLSKIPEGCIYASRCRYANETCRTRKQERVDSDHYTACGNAEALEESVDRRPEQLIPAGPAPGDIQVETKKLCKSFYAKSDSLAHLFSKPYELRVVKDVDLQIPTGRTLGIVGESGCGKTTLVRAIVGLNEYTRGALFMGGKKMPAEIKKRAHDQLKNIQMVFQNPETSLNPRHSVAEAIKRPLMLFHDYSKEDLEEKVYDLLQSVNLSKDFYHKLPDELSGGEKQRVAIARAFAPEPDVVILDEPLSALDVSVQAALMNLLLYLQAKKRTTYIFISHDLAATHYLSDYVSVMYLGKIVETGHVNGLFRPPYHPYTEALLSAIPRISDNGSAAIRLEGSVPNAYSIPSGCPFHTRCPRSLGDICRTKAPPWQETDEGGRICCHIPLETLLSMQHVHVVRKE